MSSDAHILGHAQDRLTIDSRGRVSSNTHNYQTRCLPLLLDKTTNLATHLRFDLCAHSPSIQNLGSRVHSHRRAVTRWLPSVGPSCDLTSRELNTSSSFASHITCTLRRTIQQVLLTRRKN